MNGIEKITQRIGAEAQEEIEVAIRAARGKCGEIKAQSETKAQEEYQKLMREGAKDLEQQVQRIGSSAGMEVKKSVLAMKQSYVDRVLDASMEAICALPAESYIAFLADQAADAAVSGGEELVFSSGDREKFGEKVCAAANKQLKKRGIDPKLTVAADVGGFRGGLIVRMGDIDVNCTVEKLVEMRRGELAPQIVSILFDE